MTLKHLYISAGILAVVAIITHFLTSNDLAELQDERIGGPIIEESTLRGVRKIEIQSEDDRVILAYDEPNNRWLVDNRYNMPANVEKIANLVRDITDASIQRLVTAMPERHEEFGFESPESIAFLGEDGETVAALELGKRADNGRQIFRYRGEDKAFLANTALTLDDNPDSWMVKKLVEFEADDVQSLAFELQNGDTLAAQRETKDDDWAADSLPPEKQLNQSAIDRVASRLANLSFTETASKDSEEVQAARENSHLIAVTLANGDTFRYRIGRRPEVTVMKEVETEGEDGQTTTEMEEEVETPAGPVYLFIEAEDPEHPVNEYMERAAFEVGSYQYTSLPSSLDDLLQDAPKPPPAPEPETGSPTAEEPAPAK